FRLLFALLLAGLLLGGAAEAANILTGGIVRPAEGDPPTVPIVGTNTILAVPSFGQLWMICQGPPIFPGAIVNIEFTNTSQSDVVVSSDLGATQTLTHPGRSVEIITFDVGEDPNGPTSWTRTFMLLGKRGQPIATLFIAASGNAPSASEGICRVEIM